MSRIGKKAIEVPKGVKVSINDRDVSVEGPKGTLAFTHRPEVTVGWSEDEKSIVVGAAREDRQDDRMTKAYWGTTRAILANMVKGVSDGYEKKLEIVGVGWTASLSGQNLALKVGYANIIEVPIPTGLNVSVEKQLVTVNGTDKQAVGQFCAKVRSKRKPEPYNGKGIRYFGEVIKKKQGKAFGN